MVLARPNSLLFRPTERKGGLLLKRSLFLGTTFAWLLLAGAAQASLVPWSYNWTPSSSAVLSDSGLSKITLTNEPTGTAVGTSDVVATNLKVVSSVDPNTPDTFTAKGYSLALSLTDTTSHATGTLTFSGAFSGTVSGQSSHITNAFTSAVTQSIVLGGNTYTVTIGPFTPPGPPSASNSGSISATALVSVSNGGGGGNNTPEPATMTLAGLGLAGMSLAGWRKRRATV
jgi:hypothetical protein